jgi:hypothetical protein
MVPPTIRVTGSRAEIAVDDDVAAGHAEPFASAHGPDEIASRARHVDDTGLHAAREIITGIAAYFQPSALHVTASLSADVALDRQRSVRKSCAHAIEPCGPAFDGHAIADRARYRKHIGQCDRLQSATDHKLGELCCRGVRGQCRHQSRQIDPGRWGRLKSESEPAHATSSFK